MNKIKKCSYYVVENKPINHKLGGFRVHKEKIDASNIEDILNKILEDYFLCNKDKIPKRKYKKKEYIKINNKKLNPVVAKIPVVIAELTAKMNLMSTINLPQPAIEITKIKKNVKIKECILLQETNILFINGFIRKNVEYVTKDRSIHAYTVEAPFECKAAVIYNKGPKEDISFNRVDEFEYGKVEKISNSSCEKNALVSKSDGEINKITIEYFNQRPYCEIIRSKIVENDMYILSEEEEFREIEERMVVYLTLEVLQNRQVSLITNI